MKKMTRIVFAAEMKSAASAQAKRKARDKKRAQARKVKRQLRYA